MTVPRRWLRATLILAFGALVAVGCSDDEPLTGPADTQADITQQKDGQTEKDGEASSEEEGSIEDLGPSFALEGGDFSLPLTSQNASGIVNGAGFREIDPAGSEGTGNLDPYVRLQASPQESGINTSTNNVLDNKSGSFTIDVPFNRIPRVACPAEFSGLSGELCLELTLDVNEQKNVNPSPITLDMMVLFWADQGGVSVPDGWIPGDGGESVTLNEFWDLDDEGGDNATNAKIELNYALNAGSGQGDMRAYIPTSFVPSGILEDCSYDPRETTNCETYFVHYSHFGTPEESDAGFEEWAFQIYPFVTVEKTAVTSVTHTYDWELEKLVDDDSHSLLPGESGTSNYTINVTRNGPTASGWTVEGTISISNPGDLDAEVSDVSDVIDGIGPADNLSCPATPFTVPSGGSVDCTYSHTFGSDPGDGTLNNEATVTLSSGLVVSGDSDFDFDPADNVTEVNASADLTDDFTPDGPGQDTDFGTYTGSGQETYSVTFTCDEDEGQHDNTATLDPIDAEPITASQSVTVSCAELQVTKTAETSLTRTWNWTIDKSVTPDTWDLFTGDDGTSEYTVSVDKVDSTDSDWAVAGTITVENVGSFAVNLSDVTDEVNGSLTATVDCSVDTDFQSAGGSFPYELGAGETLTCDYDRSLSSGDAGTNVATAHIVDNGTFSSDAVSFDFTDPVVTEVNSSINVTDTNGQSWGPVSDDASWNYEKSFTCDADEGQHDNTAEITETGQTDDASVTVNCYDLTVTKDANTSLTRTWDWTIDKDIDESVFLEGTYDAGTNTATVAEGQSLLVEWDVELDATSTDSEWAVDGDITIENNHPSRAATLTGVSDVVSPSIAASVTCTESSVAAGGSITCSYSADLPDATTRTNTATATLQNQSFDKTGSGTNSGTTDFSGQATVDFSGADVTMVDECVDVDDLLEQSGAEVGSQDLGTYCADQPLPKTFDVQFTFGGTDGIPLVCGDNMFDNTASFVTNDTQTTGSATSSINIFVECVEGCTLTQGYWKTHNESFRGGAPADDTWLELSNAENTTFYLSGQSWFEVFWTAPKGNVYYNLAHQYMAAYLNSLGASVPPEVQEAMDGAVDFFENNTPGDAKSLRGNNPLRHQLLDWAATLADYNEGEIGPGHCTENEEGTF